MQIAYATRRARGCKPSCRKERRAMERCPRKARVMRGSDCTTYTTPRSLAFWHQKREGDDQLSHCCKQPQLVSCESHSAVNNATH